jgi:hypothetical protein
MRLILHIFGKDVRRLAAPIIALLAIEATAAFSETQKFLSSRPNRWNELESFSGLLPFAWIFLIAALVLQERLPGTKQYWLTRPIGWPKLLAAKLLFVAIFVNAVWFLSDCMILLSLHLPVHPVALWLRQIPLAVLLFLPAFCLASLSGGLGQFALGLVIAALGFVTDLLVIIVGFSGAPGGGTHTGMTSVTFTNGWDGTWPLIALPGVTCLIIFLQFAHRATLRARLLFLIPIVFLLPFAFFTVINSSFVPGRPMTEFKSDERSPTVKVSFDFASGRRPAAAPADHYNGLQLPVRIEGLLPATFTHGSGGINLGEAANWPALLYDDSSGHWLRIRLAGEQRPQLPNNPVNVSATIRVSVFAIEKTQSVAQSSSQTFSPAPGAYCRSGSTIATPFVCWSGPARSQAVDYRAFTSSDRGPIELQASPRNLPWTFSPVISQILSSPGGESAEPPPALDRDAQVRFLTLRPSLVITRTLRAEKINLSQYRSEP